jgi:hypothetical protein
MSPRRNRLARLVLFVGAAALLGCPPPPRPQELDDLSLMLSSDVVAQAASRAPDALAEARALQGEAELAWEGGELERSARLSRLAQVQVRLAVALARQALARERQGEAEATLAEAEATYREIEQRRQLLEQRLARLWAYRDAREELAQERARAVEEEALRAERLSETERATWERGWRAQARADAADARRTLEVARMLGVAEVYPEAERMAREAIETAFEAAGGSPWRIERPLADYALAQADELRFRMLSLDEEGGPEAMRARVEALVAIYRSGFDPPFNVGLDPRGVVLTLDAKGAEIEAAFPEPVATALRDLRTKWTADESLLCLVSVRSLDPECAEACVGRTVSLARKLAAELAGVEEPWVVAVGGADVPGGTVAEGSVADSAARAARVRAIGLGYTKEETPVDGLARGGAIRIEVFLFPRVELGAGPAVEPVAAPVPPPAP